VADVTFAAGEKVIKADDFIAVFQKTIAEM
jgi:hypothetical protein